MLTKTSQDSVGQTVSLLALNAQYHRSCEIQYWFVETEIRANDYTFAVGAESTEEGAEQKTVLFRAEPAVWAPETRSLPPCMPAAQRTWRTW